jgi:hypothetical protein
MKITSVVIAVCVFTLSILNSCSSQEVTRIKKQETDSLYIFDKIPVENKFIIEVPKPLFDTVYVIQVGAFSTFEKARNFADNSELKLSRDISIDYSSDKKLYLVQIQPPYKSKEEARKYLFEIRKIKEFSDAWIVKVPMEK